MSTHNMTTTTDEQTYGIAAPDCGGDEETPAQKAAWEAFTAAPVRGHACWEARFVALIDALEALRQRRQREVESLLLSHAVLSALAAERGAGNPICINRDAFTEAYKQTAEHLGIEVEDAAGILLRTLRPEAPVGPVIRVTVTPDTLALG